MAVSAETLAKLMAAGLSGEALLDVVRSIDADNAAKPRSAGAARQAAYRARVKEARSVTSDVTRDVTESVTDDGGQKEKAPTPQKTKTNPPSPPTGAHGSHPSPRGSFLPATWEPSADDWAYGLGELHDERAVKREVEKFRDFWAGKSGAGGRKRDWSATWRNWVRKAADDLKSKRGQRHANSSEAVSFGLAEAARLRERERTLPGFRGDGEGEPSGRLLSGPWPS